jgi:hypothetical protein
MQVVFGLVSFPDGLLLAWLDFKNYYMGPLVLNTEF